MGRLDCSSMSPTSAPKSLSDRSFLKAESGSASRTMSVLLEIR